MGFPKWGIWGSLKENILFQKKKKKGKKNRKLEVVIRWRVYPTR